MSKTYDSLHMGRSSIDLYSNDIGAPFVEIESYAAYVGGSPTNISVGGKRLGLKTALLTAVGADPVGDFILHFLNNEGVETRYIPRKPEHRTSAAVLGIEPPDKFPLVFYRDNCADINLNIDDVLAAPVGDCQVFQFAQVTNLSREPSRSATLFAAEQARLAGATVVFDVDFRPDQWHDVRAFGVVARGALRLVDVVIGTEDEINAAMLSDVAQMRLTHSQVSDTKVAGDTRGAIEYMLGMGPDGGDREDRTGRGAHPPARRRGHRCARLPGGSDEYPWARAMPSAAASSMGWSKAGAGIKRRGWAMPAAPSSSLSTAAPTSCQRWTRSKLSSRPTAAWIN